MIFKIVVILSLFCFSPLHAIERFPAISPNRTGYLQVDKVHKIYWEESGNPNGFPVLFIHGGPGACTNESDRTFFDPKFYRIILFDQRGAGKSLPHGSLIDNSTWNLIEDINKLLKMLSIDQCLLFGGSWGSTLALTYAITYPETVSGLILRGIFLGKQAELNWFYQEGANYLSPEAWQILIDQVPVEKQDNLIPAYHELLHAESNLTKFKAAAAWVLWEFANLQSQPDWRLSLLLNCNALFNFFAIFYSDQNLSLARIENHFFLNRCFFESDNWILDNIHKIQTIPGVIIQGKEDKICPWENAEELHLHWPSSSFYLIPNNGHSANESGILQACLRATEDFKPIVSK